MKYTFIFVLQGFKDGRSYRWAFYAPNGNALGKIAKLVDKGDVSKRLLVKFHN